MNKNYRDYKIHTRTDFSNIKHRYLNMHIQNKSTEQIVKINVVGRNDKCPCGSGKKYKHCVRG